MKGLKTILDKLRPTFEQGGRLERLKPVFEALDHFLFAAAEKTSCAPFGRDPLDVKRFMSLVILALLPSFVASVYFFGWRVLLMLIVSYAAGGLVEVLFAVVRREEINEGFLVTGFIFPLILPPGIPLWLVALGVAFGVVFGKEIFGGTGRNLFNPALVGRVFLAISYPAPLSSAWIQPLAQPWGRLASPFGFGVPEAVTSATPLALAKGGALTGAFDLFFGRTLGSAGETSALAILLGGLFLLAVGVASWRTVLAILASFVALAAVFHGLLPAAVAPVWFQLLSGGVLFGAFFMATDPVSGPVTRGGKWAYGILIGAVTILIRSFTAYVEGVMFAILLGNIFAPLIDEVVIRLKARSYAHEG
jgi:Na+-transporting NADH:ubiquinone oxidoreductase subunit B/electron transport complex protein RnfD